MPYTLRALHTTNPTLCKHYTLQALLSTSPTHYKPYSPQALLPTKPYTSASTTHYKS
uniref:Uncharacterized protein n=1 Tax=Anguilla anguilla TaxID=7936 RepID=A0A0E9SCP4_ANGAN